MTLVSELEIPSDFEERLQAAAGLLREGADYLERAATWRSLDVKEASKVAFLILMLGEAQERFAGLAAFSRALEEMPIGKGHRRHDA